MSAATVASRATVSSATEPDADRLVASIARVRSLKAMGVLTDEEMHHQIHMLIVAQEESAQAAEALQLEQQAAPPAVSSPAQAKVSIAAALEADSPTESAALESEGVGLAPSDGVLLPEEPSWLGEFGGFDEKFAHELSSAATKYPFPADSAEVSPLKLPSARATTTPVSKRAPSASTADTALLQLASARAGAWQRADASRPSSSVPAVCAEEAVADVVPGGSVGAPAPRRAASWTVTGAECDALIAEAAASRSGTPRDGEPPRQGGDFGQGMNMDKRRCRQLHSTSFKAAIKTYRATAQAAGASRPRPAKLPPSLVDVALAATGSHRVASVNAWVYARAGYEPATQRIAPAHCSPPRARRTSGASAPFCPPSWRGASSTRWRHTRSRARSPRIRAS